MLFTCGADQTHGFCEWRLFNDLEFLNLIFVGTSRKAAIVTCCLKITYGYGIYVSATYKAYNNNIVNISDRPVRVLPHLNTLFNTRNHGHFSKMQGRRKICKTRHSRGAGQYSR